MKLMWGDPRVSDLVWQRVYPEPLSGCWLWSGGVSQRGHAMMNGRYGVHRHFLKIETGANPPSSTMACHHCDVPRCVNPAHLYWGNAKTNAADRNRRVGHPNALKLHCPKGHKLTEGNLVPWKLKRGVRECATCSNAHKMAWRQRNR